MDQFQKLGYSAEEAVMLNDMFHAITEANQWDWLRTFEPEEKRGFMWSNAPELKQIDKHVQYGGHSGTSYAWCMRQMQYIAKHGFEAFAKLRDAPFEWDSFLTAMERSGLYREQVQTLRKFERGELTYAQMRELCG